MGYLQDLFITGTKGVWTLAAEGKLPENAASPLESVPTFAHMALVSLMQANLLKFIISTNCDGLHLRSGIRYSFACTFRRVIHKRSKDKIAEIHGNTNIERCVGKDCEHYFMRDTGCRNHMNHVHNHRTGRKCQDCGEALIDTIINFDELLWPQTVSAARQNAGKADLMLCMGSSLRISTWAVDKAAKRAKKGFANLVIINLQVFSSLRFIWDSANRISNRKPRMIKRRS